MTEATARIAAWNAFPAGSIEGPEERVAFDAGWRAAIAWQRRNPRCGHKPKCISVQRCEEEASR